MGGTASSRHSLSEATLEAVEVPSQVRLHQGPFFQSFCGAAAERILHGCQINAATYPPLNYQQSKHLGEP